MPANKEQTNYRATLFRPPGRSGILSRSLFFSLSRLIDSIFSKSDRAALLRVGILLLFYPFVVALLIAGTFADLHLGFSDIDYERPSVIHARNSSGEWQPIAEFYRLNRRVIHLGDYPEGRDLKVARAFVAMEDTSFYRHFGVDPQAILRATLVNLQAGRIREGASTITQQVARLRYLSQRRTLVRKAREAFLSLILERRFTKEEILEVYLNEVPLGHGTNGVESAANFYFFKSIDELTWGEAAVLASLPTRPRSYSPLYDVNESRSKVRVVFRRLIEAGEITIAEAEEEYAKLEREYYTTLNRSPNDSAFSQRLNLYPYVSAYVLSQLPSEVRRAIHTGGYQIYTSIEIQHQVAAEAAMIPHLRQLTMQRRRPPFRSFSDFDERISPAWNLLQMLFDQPDYRVRRSRAERDYLIDLVDDYKDELAVLFQLLGSENMSRAIDDSLFSGRGSLEERLDVEGSLISMRPQTGGITAVVGGSGFTPSNQMLRFIQSRRQPGSSIKGILYAAAIDSNAEQIRSGSYLTASSLIDDSPIQFLTADLSEYSPENYAGEFEGLTRLRRGLALSKNTMAVRAYEMLGSLRFNENAERLLYYDQLDPVRSLPREATVMLGTNEMTPLELTRAYATFPAGGAAVDPWLFEKILDSQGKIMRDYAGERAELTERRIVRPGTAAIMNSMLQDVVQSGTGRAARLPGRLVAGKTGTTNNYSDGWFVGYTPELIATVHVGYDRPRTLGRAGAGGAIAAPAWARFMQGALRGERSGSFPDASSDLRRVTICARTGRLPTPACREQLEELFLPGTEPTDTGDDHFFAERERFEPPPESFQKSDVFNLSDF